MVQIRIDSSSLDRFMRKLKSETSGLKPQIVSWLDASGMQFLDEVQNEIIRMQVVDTRRMLNSFSKHAAGNIWQISNGGLTLYVGTNVEYAQYVNDGHKQSRRWVPGVWNGDSFEYQRGASTGMMLKAKTVQGKPYWDNAILIFERMFETSFERKLQEWVNQLGGTY